MHRSVTAAVTALLVARRVAVRRRDAREGRGTSDYLESGHHHDVEVTLDEPLTESQTVSEWNGTQDGDTDTWEGDQGTTQDDGAGYGVVVALLAVVGGLLVARRRS